MFQLMTWSDYIKTGGAEEGLSIPSDGEHGILKFLFRIRLSGVNFFGVDLSHNTKEDLNMMKIMNKITKKNAIGLIAVLLIAAAGTGVFLLQNKEQPEAVKNTIKLEQQDLSEYLKTDGVVAVKNEGNSFVLTAGLIEKRLVQVGDAVQKGDLLIQLDSKDLRERLQQSKYQLTLDQDSLNDVKNSGNGAVLASLQRAKTAYEKAQSDYQTNQSLYKSGSISEAELKQSNAALENANADYASAKEKNQSSNLPAETQKLVERVKLDQLTIKNLEDSIAKAAIKAPISGTVTTIADDTIGYLNVGAVAATIGDLSQLKVESMISEYDILKVRVGQSVEVSTLGNEEKNYKGIVSSIEPQGVSQNGEVFVKTIIDLLESDAQIKPNFTVSISILTAQKKGALAMPYEAVERNTDGSYFVTKVTDTKEEKISVIKGVETDLMVEVISDQIALGDSILIPSTGADKNKKMVGPQSGNSPFGENPDQSTGEE